jgi:tetrahydromethanopterin S-methyltransferase subunit D
MGRRTAALLGVALSATGVGAAITAVYLGMRDLMRQGGFCASGGPYEISSECTSGQVGLLLGGIAGLLVFAALHSALTDWADGPKIGLPAICGLLFAALGWNFIEFGADPPQGGGTVWGWLIPGVLFWLMAVGFAAPAAARSVEWLRRGGGPEPPVFSRATVRAVALPPDAEESP